ncbi:MAG: hypothetical protein P8170_14915 [Gemmatimonadota bacterium]|jgi:hypothetical protein
MNDSDVRVRLLFVDEGHYHHEEVVIPGTALGDHERLIDCVREDPAVQRQLYVDVERLCAAWIVEG